MASSVPTNDNTQAMASLMSAYGEDEGDDDAAHNTSTTASAPLDDVLSSPDSRIQHPGANFISDDEDHHEGSTQSKPLSDNDRLVNDQSANPSPSTNVSLERTNTTTKLVSYGADEIFNSDEDDDSGDELAPTGFIVQNVQGSMVRVDSTASVGRTETDTVQSSSPSPYQINEDDIQLPPEPIGNCSKRLQERVANYYLKVNEGKDMNVEIQRLKEFRNPSIYEKLVKTCAIDEQGTNYPPELYNPLIWGPNSYYDELARIQAEMLHEKEREAKKSKVEFQKGVKKVAPVPPADSSSASSDLKRKSKWDDRSAVVTNSSTAAVHSTSSSAVRHK